jgi:hypothetical protein
MLEMHALSTGAQQIHDLFESLFYPLVGFFLILGVVIEYFKLPLGGTPAFTTLVGRALIAGILLATYPEIANAAADISDALSSRLGDFNSFKLVLVKMGDKLMNQTASWISVKDTILMAISFLTFFLLYAAVYFVEAMMLYTWVILYTFSPLLIALYVLPATARATGALFRSLIEVSCWKVVFAVLATLLWSSALGELNADNTNISFITAIIYNLLLAASLLMTPVMVNALAGEGVSGVAKALGATATSAAIAGPGAVAAAAGLPKTVAKAVASQGMDRVMSRYFPSSTSRMGNPPSSSLAGTRPQSNSSPRSSPQTTTPRVTIPPLSEPLKPKPPKPRSP